MNKIIKIIISALLIINFGCAYEPILKNKDYQFEIKFLDLKGNEKINTLVSENLSYLRNNNKEKTFKIILESIKNKKVLSKDSKGDPAIFEMNIDIKLTIKNKDNIVLSENNINKKNTYNNIADKFELERYENIIINNLSRNVSDEILIIIFNLSQ